MPLRRLNIALLLAVLAIAWTAGMATAQQTPPVTKPVPPAAVSGKAETHGEPSTLSSTWDQTKAMTRKEWIAAKKKWAREKSKWRDCNREAKGEKLTAPKSWSFVAACMTKS